MTIFEQIMAPFIFIIEQILLFSYELTSNYGVSIILLSFTISLLLLPVFIYIERSKKKDDVVKKKMQPLIDEIKRVYKGQERYYYLRTISRQHNYSSFKALIPILSLLLQIPFFIAAYQFLENFAPLQQISFGFIPDLGKADGFFGSINILPIIMTLVNLVTVYFYTRNGDPAERKQMLILAIAFLVLLFNLPSGLVLYWTMNNVFSFFRLFITNPEVFKRKKTISLGNIKTDFINIFPKLKIVFAITLLLILISQFSWAFNHDFNDIYTRVGIAFVVSILLSFVIAIAIVIYKHIIGLLSKLTVQPVVFYALLFLTVYFYLASQFYFSGEDKYLGVLAILFLIPTQIIGYLYIFRSAKKANKIIYLSTNIILFLLFVYQLFIIGSFINNEELQLIIAKINITIELASFSDMLIPGIAFSMVSLFYFNFLNKTNDKEISKPDFSIYLLAIFYVLGLIYYWSPLSRLASYPDAFEYVGLDILKNNFFPFLLSLVLALGLYFLTPRKYKVNALLIVVVMAFVTFVNTTIIPIDLGSLQINKYANEADLSAATYYYIIEAFVLIALMYYTRILLLSKKTHYLKYGLLALNIILISQSLFQSFSSNSFFEVKKEKAVKSNDIVLETKKDKPSKANDIFRFSKTKKNVVFILPDMFQGCSMEKILEENPEFNDIYSGFVWYPNTLSIARLTNASMPALLGGFDYFPNILDRDTVNTIRYKTTKSMEKMMKQAHNDGFVVTATKFPYVNIDELNQEHLMPYWSDEWNVFNDQLKINKSNEDGFSILTQNALFYSVPLFLKPEVYNKGKWLHIEGEATKDKRKNTWIARKYNFLRLLPLISTAEDDNANLMMLYSSVPHFPWKYIGDDGAMVTDVSPTTSATWSLEKFALWIQWMKDNDDDNTKIIIVSDHGTTWEKYEEGIDIDNPFKNYKGKNKISQDWLFHLNPLLLVKDYGAHGSLKQDLRMMSNADVNSILFDENNPTKGIAPKHRTLTGYIAWWSKKIGDRKKFIIQHGYEVRDNVFDINNWKKIDAH